MEYSIRIFNGDTRLIGVKHTEKKEEVHELCRLAPEGGGAEVSVGKDVVADYIKSGDSMYWYT